MIVRRSIGTIKSQQISQINSLQQDIEGCSLIDQLQYEEKEYQLLMSGAKQWNFTLGDIEDSNVEKNKAEMNSLFNQQSINKGYSYQIENYSNVKGKERSKSKSKSQLSPALTFTMIKTVPSTHFPPLLNALLPLSMIPASPFRHNQPIQNYRLHSDNQQYILIYKMFESRGGVIGIRKLIGWDRSKQTGKIGFLIRGGGQATNFNLNKQKQLQLIKKHGRDVVAPMPNAFSSHHIIVRTSGNNNANVYPCAYFIETPNL